MALSTFAELLELRSVFTPTVARSGTRYRVRGHEVTIPELHFRDDPKTYLLEESCMDKLADLMEYADRILNTHGIDYVVCFGTLLGTFRHKGLIPWDDDADIFIIKHSDVPRIAELSERIAADGYRLIEVNSYFKLTHASSPLGFPLSGRLPALESGEQGGHLPDRTGAF